MSAKINNNLTIKCIPLGHFLKNLHYLKIKKKVFLLYLLDSNQDN